jgi:hypothetical protein
MRDSLWRRLEALEAARSVRRDMPVRMINFVRADGLPTNPTVARGPDDYICHRRVGEELEAFQARAFSECRVSRSRPPPILVFMES